MPDIKNKIDAESAYEHSDTFIANYLLHYAHQDFNEIVAKSDFEDDDLRADWSEESDRVRFTITLTTDLIDPDTALRILEQSRLDDEQRPEPSWTDDEKFLVEMKKRRARR